MAKKTEEKVAKKRGRPAADKPKKEEGRADSGERNEPKVKLPRYENAQVVEVLSETPDNGFIRCRMDDGTVKDVPENLFQ